MMTVKIEVNGNVIYCRSAVNITKGEYEECKWNKYKVDTGEVIEHKPIDGAIPLAKKLLDTIKET